MMIRRLPLFFSFILVLFLTILPMPSLCQGIKPVWVLLLLFYVQFYLPDYFHLLTLFVLGLLVDILLSTIIGEHILALTLVTWIASTKARRFYCFSISKQVALIAFFCLLYQLILLTIEAFLKLPVNLFGLLGSTLVTAVLWPFFCLILELNLMTRKYKKT